MLCISCRNYSTKWPASVICWGLAGQIYGMYFRAQIHGMDFITPNPHCVFQIPNPHYVFGQLSPLNKRRTGPTTARAKFHNPITGGRQGALEHKITGVLSLWVSVSSQIVNLCSEGIVWVASLFIISSFMTVLVCSRKFNLAHGCWGRLYAFHANE